MAGKEIIDVENGPPSHPYMSLAIKAGRYIFVSGSVGLMWGEPPHGQGKEWMPGELVKGGIEAETRQTLENIKIVLEAAGASMSDIVKLNTYLRDIDRDFHTYNDIYQDYFPADPPARTTVAATIYGGILVEMDCVAYLPDTE